MTAEIVASKEIPSPNQVSEWRAMMPPAYQELLARAAEAGILSRKAGLTDEDEQRIRENTVPGIIQLLKYKKLEEMDRDSPEFALGIAAFELEILAQLLLEEGKDYDLTSSGLPAHGLHTFQGYGFTGLPDALQMGACKFSNMRKCWASAVLPYILCDQMGITWEGLQLEVAAKEVNPHFVPVLVDDVAGLRKALESQMRDHPEQASALIADLQEQIAELSQEVIRESWLGE